MSSTPWTFDATQSTARLHTSHLSATLNLAQPDRGLHAITFDGRPSADCTLFALQMPSGPIGPLADCYVRGSDLIATYAETPGWPVRMQVYWRVLGPALAERLPAIEYIASVQTSLLDSQPAVHVESRVGRLPDRPIVEEGSIVARLADGALSYAQFFDPADVVLSVRDQSLIATLFQRPLEKGVILRSRLRGCFMPRADDLGTARVYHHDFVASEIPLTV
jgi:hypothetical protein